MKTISSFLKHWKEHQSILEEVFRRIRAAGLKVKRDKCQFAQGSVKSLGHIVSAQGTDPDTAKVDAVRDFATPSCLPGLVAKAFVDEVISKHGVPNKLLTDQGRNFEADIMRQVFRLLEVKKWRTSPYHPQTDGQVERLNRMHPEGNPNRLFEQRS